MFRAKVRPRNAAPEVTGERSWEVFPWATPGNRARRELAQRDDRRSCGAQNGPCRIAAPTISVVLPVYNHGRYLEESIRSVLSEKDYPVELIVVDDGSTDNSSSIVQRFTPDDRVRFIRKANGGLSAALNDGFALARGDFLTWTSADNRFHPGAISRLTEFLIANPLVGLVYADIRLIGEDGRPGSNFGYRATDASPHDPSVRLLPCAADTLWWWSDNFINACFLYRSSVAALVGQYRSRFRGYEDYDYWLRVSQAGRVAHLDHIGPLYDYRIHSESLTAELSETSLRTGQLPLVSAAAHAHQRRGAGHDAPGVTVEYATPEYEEAARSVSQLLGCTGAACTDPVRSVCEEPLLRIRLANCVREAMPFRSFATQLPHSTHERYLWAGFRGLRLRTGSGAWRAAIPPAIEVPPLFRRARDANYGAIPRHASKTLALFCPDTEQAEPWLSEFRALCARYPSFRWVVVVRAAGQRWAAEALASQESLSQRVLVVDHTMESAGDWFEPNEGVLSDQPEQERSLMFVLSGVDAVCELLRSESPAEELQLLITATIAAAARLPVITFIHGPAAPRSDEPVARCSYGEWIRAAPNISIVDPSEESEFPISLFRRPAIGSCEQWIEYFGRGSAANRIRGTVEIPHQDNGDSFKASAAR